MTLLTDNCILVTPKGYRRPSNLVASDFVLCENNEYRRVNVEPVEAVIQSYVLRHGLAVETTPNTLVKHLDGTYKPIGELELKQRIYKEMTPWWNDYGWTTELLSRPILFEDYTNFKKGELDFENPGFAFTCGSYVANHSFGKTLKCQSYWHRERYYQFLEQGGLKPILEDGFKNVKVHVREQWFWELMEAFFERYDVGKKPSIPDDILLGCSVPWAKVFMRGFFETVSKSKSFYGELDYCCPGNAQQLVLDIGIMMTKCAKPFVLNRKTAASGAVEDYRISLRKVYAKKTHAIKIESSVVPVEAYEITNKDNLALHVSGLLVR